MGGDLPPRGSFATLTDADVARFRSILESTPGDVARAVLTDEKSLADANEDWTRAYRGRSRVLLLPRTTSQVAAIVRHCNDRNLAVVPQGGNTGLVGGGVPVHDEVVLGMKRMRSVVSIDPSAGVVVAEARDRGRRAERWRWRRRRRAEDAVDVHVRVRVEPVT